MTEVKDFEHRLRMEVLLVECGSGSGQQLEKCLLCVLCAPELSSKRLLSELHHPQAASLEPGCLLCSQWTEPLALHLM